MALESILQLGFRAGFGEASLDQEDLQRFDDAFGSNFRCHTQLAQPLFAEPWEIMPALMKDDSGSRPRFVMTRAQVHSASSTKEESSLPPNHELRGANTSDLRAENSRGDRYCCSFKIARQYLVKPQRVP
ncbi:unnamed protein product [Ixodes pacificus]